ncbi:hypothetical protein MBAV_005803 [Candidatus Magnetobacterium bavaricum]|uniref:Uncharacterized protein n=1 Tax=Candidatus Magnetobacterium bavaricum TaxID=29290 RepID=A0A0F3GJ66_9BACT|nr:hypothetical protein MBAV_005803 [Candidatus Magnetobacterium bavaricum]
MHCPSCIISVRVCPTSSPVSLSISPTAPCRLSVNLIAYLFTITEISTMSFSLDSRASDTSATAVWKSSSFLITNWAFLIPDVISLNV